LSDFDRERLLLHAQILREQAKRRTSEAPALLQVARCFDQMLEEDRSQRRHDAEAAMS
jgi:hypothetical protein